MFLRDLSFSTVKKKKEKKKNEKKESKIIHTRFFSHKYQIILRILSVLLIFFAREAWKNQEKFLNEKYETHSFVHK